MSPRGAACEFVTRKITSGVACILPGQSREVRLGSLEAKRDSGHARECAKAMRPMLQQPVPDDYVIATGGTYSVQEVVELAFSHVGLNYKDYVAADPTLFRPAEVNLLLGDCTKVRTKLGWTPSTTFEALVREMVGADCRALGVEHGFGQREVGQLS